MPKNSAKAKLSPDHGGCTVGVAMEMLRGGADDSEAGQSRRLRCALMGMSSPVDVIVQRILGDPAS